MNRVKVNSKELPISEKEFPGTLRDLGELSQRVKDAEFQFRNAQAAYKEFVEAHLSSGVRLK